MKKLIALIVILALCLGLVACGGSGNATTTEKMQGITYDIPQSYTKQKIPLDTDTFFPYTESNTAIYTDSKNKPYGTILVVQYNETELNLAEKINGRQKKKYNAD